MNLIPGTRLRCGEGCAYVCAQAAWTTSRHCFYRARKVFWNYHDEPKELYEADQDEWLDVLLRVPILTEQAAGQDGEAYAGAIQFELEQVLSGPVAPWFPRPIDRIEAPALGADGSPAPASVLVLPDPHGAPLSSGPPAPGELPRLLCLLDELLMLIDCVRQAGLSLGPIEPADLYVAPSGWTFFGTDRVTQACSADQRGELLGWGRLACQVLTGSAEQLPAPSAGRDDATRSELARLSALVELSLAQGNECQSVTSLRAAAERRRGRRAF